MTFGLSRATFRRLVQLNWLALISFVPLAVWQVLSQGWSDFDIAFTKLLGDTYGYSEQPDWMQWTLGAFFLIHVAGAIGIYWFNRWARLALWLPVLIVAALDITFGQAATYEPTIQTWIGTFSDAIFGAVVFSSYCQPVASEFFRKADSGDPV